MSQYLPCERETSIRMNDEDNGAHISTYQASMHKRLLKLAEANPDVIDPARIRNYNDSLSTNATVPADWIAIRPTKRMNLSEEQINNRREQGKKLKQSQIILNPKK